jgi:hypothetical protein
MLMHVKCMMKNLIETNYHPFVMTLSFRVNYIVTELTLYIYIRRRRSDGD